MEQCGACLTGTPDFGYRWARDNFRSVEPPLCKVMGEQLYLQVWRTLLCQATSRQRCRAPDAAWAYH